VICWLTVSAYCRPILKAFSRLLLDHRLTIVSHCQTLCIRLSGFCRAIVRLLSGYFQAINKHSQLYSRPSEEIVRLSCFRVLSSHCQATFRGPVRTLAGHRNHWKVTVRRLLALSDVFSVQGQIWHIWYMIDQLHSNSLWPLSDYQCVYMLRLRLQYK
jgi:hypothetical protein